MKYWGYEIINPFRSHTPKGFYDPIKGHTGVDLLTPIRTPLYFTKDTIVADVRSQKEMGLTLYLSDGEKVWVFSHLSEVNYVVGDKVKAGKVFAYTGNTGTATTGPHVHVEVIATAPQEGHEEMTRTLGNFSGYNWDPQPLLDEMFATHWSEEAMQWMLTHEIITQPKDPLEPVKWGELAVVSQRLAERILDWADNEG